MKTDSPIRFRPRSRPLLLYILGWGRSGSSVLANLVGSLEGGASLGEVRYLWDRGILNNGICGCGSVFSECAFWPDLKMGSRRLGAIGSEEARSLARTIGSGARPAQFPALQNPTARRAYFERNHDALSDLMGLYTDAFEQSGASVMVDASKSPFYAVNLLCAETPFDVAFLHLVRDPRAVMHSWKKTKQREDSASGGLFPRYSSFRSLLQWSLINTRCERFSELAPAAYRRMRYEDFADNWPQALMSAAPDLFERTGNAMEHDGRTGAVVAQHSISGNPSRFELGQIHLTPDAAWQDSISGFSRKLAAISCSRIARRYGYDI